LSFAENCFRWDVHQKEDISFFPGGCDGNSIELS